MKNPNIKQISFIKEKTRKTNNLSQLLAISKESIFLTFSNVWSSIASEPFQSLQIEV